MTVELVAEQDRRRPTEPCDFLGRCLDHEAAAVLGPDQEAGEVLRLQEGRQVRREVAPRERGRLAIAWPIR